ncbi:unnamed protein product [Cylindrotheca closterium]|uniref:Fe2OG dioxygenase domain-containing protein n=1 Tax=Cylindrotheca closterium TaxID=2856 RepID=A0AAD2JJR8_9STRA|nr:unnamed protein product [Cylindrotheca closterium]
MAPYGYAGEEFLSVELPNYEMDRLLLMTKLVVGFVAWLVVIPVMLASPPAAAPPQNAEEKKQGTANRATTTTKNGATTRTKTIKIVETTTKKKKKEMNGKSKKANVAPEHSVKKANKEESEEPTVKQVSELANMLCILGFMVTFLYMIIVTSPDNRYTTRGVFEAPLFTREECDHLVDMAETVAQRNYEAAAASEANATIKDRDLLVMEPVGWQKKRHEVHSTTDLNVITDPFSKSDRQWIKEKLNARLAPTIERLYGVPQGSIRANDIFVIRYDGNRQASLNPHTDDGDVTFSALLSDGFTGGGTNYYDRRNQYYHTGNTPYQPQPDEVFAHVLPQIGQMTLFRSPILHEGVQVKKGRRYLLIGFLSVDNVDPWSEDNKSTGLSWFASWFSLNWASVRFKTGYSAAITTHNTLKANQDDWMTADEQKGDWMSESTYIRGLFIQFHSHLTMLADFWNAHFFQQIIPADQTKPYLEKMDEAYSARSHKRPSHQLPSWFSGQQVDLNIDGSFHSEWSTRKKNSEKFDREEI